MDFSAVVIWYVHILPPFVLQVAIVEGVLGRNLKRRPLLLPRLAGCCLVMAGALWFAAWAVIYLISVRGAMVTPVYVALFLMTVGVMKVCLDEPFATVLFYGITAYATQNLAYRIYSLLELYGIVWRAAEKIGYWQSYHLLFWGVFAVVAAAVFALFNRYTVERDAACLCSRNIYSLSVITLVVTTVLCTWTNAYSWESRTLTGVNYLFSCLCCIFILCMQSGMLKAESLKRDLAVVKRLWEQDRKQYEISRENIDIINIKCHDLRFRLQSLRTAEGEASREELEEIENAITIYDSRIDTGCEPLDTILTEKSLFCSKNGIKFTCMVDGSKLSFIAPSDIYSLFGNIISNAVEAVRRVEDTEQRIIIFTVRQIGNMVLVLEENYFADTLIVCDGLPVTSKKDKLNHGYGMKSIQMLVRKYGGDMNISASDNVFTLKLLFPLAG